MNIKMGCSSLEAPSLKITIVREESLGADKNWIQADCVWLFYNAT